MKKSPNIHPDQPLPSADIYVKAYGKQDRSVIYETQNADKLFCFKGGTRSWRNNNPGNIIYGTFAAKHGAIGMADRFACFPDKQTGQKALLALLKTSTYQKCTLEQAIYKYAPPCENDTSCYLNHIVRHLDVPANTLLSNLTDTQLNQMANLIEQHEGFKPGTIEQIEA